MGPFIAYFPSWVKFHELFRFDAYLHPFDFISKNYQRDLQVSAQVFAINGVNWEDRFEALKAFAIPFAFLNPPMQEGSTLGEPFLPLNELSLPGVHQLMGLGSIWTIGPSHIPAQHGLLCAKYDLHTIVPEEGSNAWSMRHVARREPNVKANFSVEPNSVLTTPYSSLKRKMQEELYDPISKKMKSASKVSLEMGSFSVEVAGRYMSVVHNEVFRIAGRAGLINPADFDVGSDGVIGLSEHALQKVYSRDEANTLASEKPGTYSADLMQHSTPTIQRESPLK
ncbi:uncharacterized protein BKA55DRAFT_684087 [Fusarium redolens]|uniref:Uncharacterized protein n=1 Tax=Fusarium redolens TaxID=48865 RepID=A0A9P9KQY7_FUSRE|nr:uncharacterized protein BKA55DRAFT_684087 [Fusarium redolens]KAH7266808.1 hypothetical protein BKA55DRAFT_684087 [Fusarium redolens]